jgi:hypothetical protein
MSEHITELYVHRRSEKRIELITVTETMTVADAVGLEDGECVWAEESEEELKATITLIEAAIPHRGHVHVNRCRKVEVKVTYNGVSKAHTFAPSAKVARVRKWALSKHGFDLTPTDAADHVLVFAGTTVKPDLTDHVGSFVEDDCGVAFDLVPKPRTEG